MPRKLKNDELNRLSAEEFRRASKNEVVVVLDNVRSMHNVGSTFRTSDAFRIEKLILCGVTARPPHREIEKTALGATEHVSWEHYGQASEAISRLRDDGYKIYAVEQTSESISLGDFICEGKAAFVFGNEVYGVDENIVNACDGCIEIPQQGSKHSLNVAVTIGIVLWHVAGNEGHKKSAT